LRLLTVRKLAVAAMTIISLGLSGCGMTPVYGERSLTTSLSQIEVEAPDTRIGYFLRQQLITGFGETGSAKAYDLKIAVEEKRYEIGLSNFGTATRFEISANVSYTLTARGGSSKPLYKNSFVQTVTYDSTDSSYAAISAQKDGQERAATAISRQIQNQLAAYFLKPQSSEPKS
jgi:LPS-assembly lipoprotein